MKTTQIRDEFLEAISSSFKMYNKSGARSNKKLVPIHSWFAKIIDKNTDKKYTVMSLGSGEGKEYVFDGKYYPKNLDITIFYEQKPIIAISFKFVTSNYAQNSNNYFENLLGETANVRRANVAFAHFLVLRASTPYYDKNRGNKRGKLQKIETLSEHHLLKYIKLFQDHDFPHKPDVLGIAVLDFNEKNKATMSDLSKLSLGKETLKVMQGDFDIEKFIQRILALCKLRA